MSVSPLDHQISDRDSYVSMPQRFYMCRDHTSIYQKHTDQNTRQTEGCSPWVWDYGASARTRARPQFQNSGQDGSRWCADCLLTNEDIGHIDEIPTDAMGAHLVHSLEIQGKEGGEVFQIKCTKAREIIQLDSDGGSIDVGYRQSDIAETYICQATPLYPVEDDDGDLQIVL